MSIIERKIEKFIKTVRRDVVTRRTCNGRMENGNIRGMVQKDALLRKNMEVRKCHEI